MKKIFYIMMAVIMASAANAECTESKAIRALALNMYHEARDQGTDGMLMIADVTLNRVASEHFPNTICGVVYQGRRDGRGNMLRHQCQFSWYCDGLSDRATNKEIWDQVESLAEGIVTGDIETLNSGATHYLNPDKVTRMPRWTQVYEPVGMWGDHHFYAMGDRL